MMRRISVIDLVAFAGCFLDALAGAGAHVQADQAGIHAGEEVASQEQSNRSADATQNSRNSARTSRRDRGKSPELAVSLAHALETLRETALDAREDVVAGGVFLAVVVLEQIHRQRRHQGARKDVRSQHGENDCFRQRHEQELAPRP